MEDLIYYFYDYRVETASVEIRLPGWQKLTEEEIVIYKSGEFKRIDNVNGIYSFNSEDDFDLEQYKRIKIEYLSGESFTLGEQIMPEYKYKNCLISINLVARGENPIYPDFQDKILEYENSRVDLRNAFYVCKKSVESATTKEEIDNINLAYEKRT